MNIPPTGISPSVQTAGLQQPTAGAQSVTTTTARTTSTASAKTASSGVSAGSEGFSSSRLVSQLFGLMGFGGQQTVILAPPRGGNSPTIVEIGGDAPKEAPKTEPKKTPVSLVKPEARIFEATGSMAWQPKGKDGSAEMIFRPQHKGMIAKVELLSEDGTKVIARPRSVGVDSKGRPVFRFSESGENFPKGAIVMMTMTGGGVRYLEIPNPAKSFRH